MSNQQFLKSQTCVIRVNIHCDGCKQKVRKLLQKIEGVYTVTIDAEKGKVSVTGNIDPDMLVKKLVKSGKHAELWGSSAQKGSNNFQNQFKNMQILDNFSNKNTGKDQNKNKNSQKGGDKDQSSKTGQVLQQIMQQMKGGSKNPAKVPSSKDKKSDKFHMGNRDFSEFGDGDFDSNDDDFDSNDDEYDYEDDSCEEDDDDEILPTKGNKGHGHNGNSKKGGPINVPVQLKGKDGKNDAKNKNNNGAKNGSGDGGKNKGGDKNQSANAKNGGKNDPKNGSNGKDKNGGGKNNNNGGGKKGGGKNDGFKEVDVNNHGKNGGQMGNFPMGQMGNFPMGNIPGMHGLPTPAAMNGGYYHQGGNNPYNNQQQYMAMMMNAQQRANGNGMNQQMMYARPHAPVSYGPPMPAPVPVDNYTHMFSDENTNGCSIM